MRGQLLTFVALWQTIGLVLLTVYASVATAGEYQPLSVTVSSNRDSAYSNEQILVTVRLEVDSRAFSLTGDELAVENATVLSLSKNTTMDHSGGYEMIITERRYAVFGNSPGVVEIPALNFQAQMPVSTSVDGSKTNPRLQAGSQAISISVNPPPPSGNTWFPAGSVSLERHWGDEAAEAPGLVAGEPVDIHFTIKVTGQHPAAIPPLQIVTSENLRSYPAAPDWEAYQSKLGFGGLLTQRVTLVASDNQEAVINQLQVPWWDINARRWRVAKLSRQTLVVQGADSGWYAGSPKLVVAAIAALLTLALLYAGFKLTVAGNRPTTETSAWRAVKRAIDKKDMLETRNALLVWCRQLWPDARILGAESIGLKDESVARVIRQFEEGIYSGGRSVDRGELDWDQLFGDLQLLRKNRKKSVGSFSAQEHLYPGGTTSL